MTLAELFIGVSIIADYMDIINLYPGEKEETIRLTSDMLTDMWDYGHSDGRVESVEFAIGLFESFYDTPEEEREKLISWLDKNVDSMDLKDGKHLITLFEDDYDGREFYV